MPDINKQTESKMTNTQNSADSLLQNRAAVVARAEKIREAARRAKLLPYEQERVAENLWRILEEAEKHGCPKSTVLRQGGAGNEGDSTKRLERFALNPDLDQVRKQVKLGRLTKGAEKYLKIAEAAGRLVENDADAYVAQLFNGTRFVAAGEPAVSEDVYVEMADLVRTVCAGVARKHSLQEVFRLCDERRLCYYSRSLRQNRDDRWSNVWRGFADGARVVGLFDETDTWAMPYPSVLVGWSELAKELPFKVGRAGTASIFNDPGEEKLSPDSPVLKGTFQVEVRLALLPIGPGGTVEPAFIACPWVAIPFGHMKEQPDEGADGKYSLVTDRWTFESNFEGVEADCCQRGTPASLWHFGYACQPLFGPEIWEGAFRDFAGSEPGRSYWDAYRSASPVRVDVVSPASCRRYLSLLRAPSAVTGLECPTIVDDLDPALGDMDAGEYYRHWRKLDEGTLDDPESPRWLTEPGTLAEAVEYSTLTVSDEDRRFDVVLDRACSRYAKEVAEVLASVDGWRETAKAQLRAKWGEASPPPDLTDD